MKNKYNKLVRDNIIDIIKANGEKPIYHTLSDNEYWDALLIKDTEEDLGYMENIIID